MKKLKVAVIGIGNMGMIHARIYSELKDCNLIAVADNDTSKVRFTKKLFYASYQNLIKEKKPDLVSICVPTSLHYKVTKDCLEKGIHCLVEKPITDSNIMAKKLLILAKKKKKKLLVGHVERFNPAIRRTKEILENKELGKIITISIKRVGMPALHTQDSDVALDLGIHDVDIANYLLNEIPTKVNINKQISFSKNHYDSAEFFLQYKSGASVHIQTNWITPVKIRTLSITGTKGYLELDFIKQDIKIFKNSYEKLKIDLEKKEPLKEELSYFINCVQNNIKVDSQYALDALKICLI